MLNNKERVFHYRRFHLGRQMNWVKNDFVPSSHAPNRTSCQSYFLAINLARHVLRNKADRLRVVPLSLCPSCVTRKKTVEKNGRVKSWGRESTCFSPPGFHAAIFFAVFFRVTHDRQSERGTIRSLVCLLLWCLPPGFSMLCSYK